MSSARRLLIAAVVIHFLGARSFADDRSSVSNLLQQFQKNASTDMTSQVSMYKWDPPPSTDTDGNIEDRNSGGLLELTIKSDAEVKSDEVFKFDFYAVSGTARSNFRGTANRVTDRRRLVPHAGFREIYWRKSTDRAEYTAGKAFVSMGQSTLYSPSDLYNVVGSTDPVATEKYGTWQIARETFIGDDSLKFYFLPYNEPGKLPSRRSRWRGESGDAQFTQLAIPGQAAGSSLSEKFHKTGARHFGYLLKYKGVKEGADYSVALHHGLSPYPVVHKSDDPADTTNTGAYKISIMALTASAAAALTTGAWEHHFEWVAQISHEGRDQNFFRYVIGTTYRETKIAAGLGLEEITPTFEYGGEQVSRERTNPDILATSLNARPIRNTLLSRIEFKRDDKIKWVLASVNNFTENDKSVSGGLDYRPDDNTEIQLMLQFFDGTAGTYFGQWGRNDRIWWRVNYKM